MLFVAFHILSLSVIFVMITMCLGVFLSEFILCGTLSASWSLLIVSVLR